MTKSSAQKPRRRRGRMTQRTAGAPVENPQEPPVEQSVLFLERDQPRGIREHANELVERQALEPEPGEDAAPTEIERDRQ